MVGFEAALQGLELLLEAFIGGVYLTERRGHAHCGRSRVPLSTPQIPALTRDLEAATDAGQRPHRRVPAIRVRRRGDCRRAHMLTARLHAICHERSLVDWWRPDL